MHNGHAALLSRSRAIPALPPEGSDRHVVAVDIALFTIQDESLKVLLVKRAVPPFPGWWSLPGGFVGRAESVDEAALRELQEETGITTVYLEQLYTFGDLDRDPRGRVISVSYYALVDWERFRLKAHSSAKGGAKPAGTRWFSVNRLPTVAFDHRKIVTSALERLRNKVNYTSAAFQLLPKKFTLSELQRAYEVILGQPLDKRNFRKKMLQLGILKDTRERQVEGRQRPARLYAFTEARVIKLQEKGIIVPF
ncbi:MAG: NUDIX hydrolase [Candidatus Omnitrophica bacterium]|nr:NUDIX hydrolase [Candidatus Omnitrophota bacterium]